DRITMKTRVVEVGDVDRSAGAGRIVAGLLRLERTAAVGEVGLPLPDRYPVIQSGLGDPGGEGAHPSSEARLHDFLLPFNLFFIVDHRGMMNIAERGDRCPDDLQRISFLVRDRQVECQVPPVVYLLDENI